jgi:BMFP domain-containing protein YqiC
MIGSRNLFNENPLAFMKKNVQALVKNVIAELNLVTREEFDVQTQVLLRTREKIDYLEEKIAELEKKLSEKK